METASWIFSLTNIRFMEGRFHWEGVGVELVNLAGALTTGSFSAAGSSARAPRLARKGAPPDSRIWLIRFMGIR